jgi:hypothetical protein
MYCIFRAYRIGLRQSSLSQQKPQFGIIDLFITSTVVAIVLVLGNLVSNFDKELYYSAVYVNCMTLICLGVVFFPFRNFQSRVVVCGILLLVTAATGVIFTTIFNILRWQAIGTALSHQLFLLASFSYLWYLGFRVVKVRDKEYPSSGTDTASDPKSIHPNLQPVRPETD